MEKYEQMTKAQLIGKLEEQQHLVDAIDAKDLELNKLRDEKEQELEKLRVKLSNANAKLEEQKHLADAVEAKDAEIAKLFGIKNTLKTEIEGLKANLGALPDQVVVDNLKRDNARLAQFINRYINVFQNNLKTQQATLENTIELEALLVGTLKVKE